jgi:hypothetical protein
MNIIEYQAKKIQAQKEYLLLMTTPQLIDFLLTQGTLHNVSYLTKHKLYRCIGFLQTFLGPRSVVIITLFQSNIVSTNK